MTYTIKITQDDDPLHPRTEFDNVATMACFHRRYNLGDKQHDLNSDDFNSWDEMAEYVEKELKALYLPIYLYDHSGLTINTTGFSCPWDSGKVGIIYITKEQIKEELGCKIVHKKAKEWAYNMMRAEVEAYDKYLTGDVWGYEILDDDENVVDSCWGYYGHDYCEQTAKEVVEHLTLKQAA